MLNEKYFPKIFLDNRFFFAVTTKIIPKTLFLFSAPATNYNEFNDAANSINDQPK
jgi:hypothetical protein